MSDSFPAQPPGHEEPSGRLGPRADNLSRLQEEHRRLWARGERSLVEDLLAALAPEIKDPDDLLDLIYHEVLIREEFGENPTIDEYLRRFPRFAGQLRDQFEVHLALKSTQWPRRGDEESRRQEPDAPRRRRGGRAHRPLDFRLRDHP